MATREGKVAQSAAVATDTFKHINIKLIDRAILLIFCVTVKTIKPIITI